MDRGFYRIGNETFLNKTVALKEATRRGITPTWHFHDHIFTSIDWKKDIPYSIDQLYLQRAKQLRDSYDHLILNFSGGSDSTTILRTFVENNIPLDEIFCYWPVEAIKNIHRPDPTNFDPSNILSEWDYSIKPTLDYVRKFYPKIKITISDYSDRLFDDISETMFNFSTNHVNVGFFLRQEANLGAGANLKENKKIAIVTGNDKPQICVKDNKIYGYFLDILCTTARNNLADTNQVVELFYWNPEIPQIPIKGCQMVAEAVKKQKELSRYFILGKRLEGKDRTRKDEIVRSIVYKSWDMKTFQVGKVTNDFCMENDNWIAKHYGSNNCYQSWKNAMKFYFDQIDKKYFYYTSKNERAGYTGFISPLFEICDL